MTQEFDPGDAEAFERYRAASRQEGAAPSESTRAAILAEGRRMAARRLEAPAAQGLDRKRPTAHRSRWKLFTAGSVALAGLATLLVVPRVFEPSNRHLTASDEVSRERAVPPPPATPAEAGPSLQAERLAPSAPKSFASSQARTASAQRQFSAAAPRTADAASKAASNSASNTATAAASAAGGAAALGGVLTESPTPLPGSVASLWSAIAAGDSRRTELLLDQGADTRGLDPLGRTPLSLAVIRQRADLVRLLLAHGADPNARDQSGDTPLERARQEGRADILAMLQAAGAH